MNIFITIKISPAIQIIPTIKKVFANLMNPQDPDRFVCLGVYY